jgi:hypothetical protein
MGPLAVRQMLGSVLHSLIPGSVVAVTIGEFRTNHRTKHVAKPIETSAYIAHNKKLATIAWTAAFIKL